MNGARRAWLVAAALVGGIAACGDGGGPVEPVAGNLLVVLATPNSGADGAILFTLSGPAAPLSATGATGLRVFAEPFAPRMQFAITGGTLSTGTILTLAVEDVNKVSQYSATIRQVANTANFVLRPLSGYSLRVRK